MEFRPDSGPSAAIADNELTHASDWFTQILTRGMSMIALTTGDPEAIEICGLPAGGTEKPRASSVTHGKRTPTDAKSFSTLFAVLYLTGEQKYKEPLAEAIKGDSMLSVGGCFPACNHWLLTHPPKGKQ